MALVFCFIFGWQVLEKARRINAILFDKTGTLTLGRPSVQACVGADEGRILWAAASCEASSEHPLALAIVNAFRALPEERQKPLVGTSEFETLAGEGLRCRLSTPERQQILVGNRKLMQHFNVVLPEKVLAEAASQADLARTVVFIAGLCNGCFVFLWA